MDCGVRGRRPGTHTKPRGRPSGVASPCGASPSVPKAQWWQPFDGAAPVDKAPQMNDIVSEVPAGTYVVTGWFSEDAVYRPLAERLADNLHQLGTPFHFYACEKRDGWDTRLKPTIALQAMEDYPGKTVILMDVDCRVNGDLSPLRELAGDVGLCMQARPYTRRGRERPRWVAVRASSRVVVFRPLGGAVSFAREWERLCADAGAGGDEGPMTWAYLGCPWVVYHQIAPAYAAQGALGAVSGAIIEHDRAHDRQKAQTWKGWLRGIEKRFLRTGRTGRNTRTISVGRIGRV